MKRPCHIVVCGDLCPTPNTAALFTSENVRALFDGLAEIFEEADLVVGNLECPLIDGGVGIAKCGPVLKAPRQSLRVLKASGFRVLSLANNHIRDCGDEGVLSTLECCRREGIVTVGAGQNATRAQEPVIVQAAGWKVGIMAFAEHEFNAASEQRAGANLLDPFYSWNRIQETRSQCDYLIVLYHGGIEHYPYPSPLLQKKCRKMVESGANMVLCQHSHCVGTVENYRGATILYGQGNTLFGYYPQVPGWNEGLIVKLCLSEDQQHGTVVEYIPIAATAAGVEVLPAEQASAFLKAFLNRSERISSGDFVHTSWRGFCKAKRAHYLPQLLALGRVFTYLNRKLGNLPLAMLLSKKRLRITMNLLRCEAHHEVLDTMLQDITSDVL